MVPIYRPDGTVALPEILPQNEVPCQHCSGVARWTRRWGNRGDSLLYEHRCPSCRQFTVSEYHADGKIERRKSSGKRLLGVPR